MIGIHKCWWNNQYMSKRRRKVDAGTARRVRVVQRNDKLKREDRMDGNQSAREGLSRGGRLMNVCLEGGGRGGHSGCTPRTLCLSQSQISHPDSTAVVFFLTDTQKRSVFKADAWLVFPPGGFLSRPCEQTRSLWNAHNCCMSRIYWQGNQPGQVGSVCWRGLVETGFYYSETELYFSFLSSCGRLRDDHWTLEHSSFCSSV